MIPLFFSWGASGALFVIALGLVAVGTTLYDHRLWRARWLLPLLSAVCVSIGFGFVLWRWSGAAHAGLGVRLVWTLLPILMLAGLGVVFAAPVHRLLGLIRRWRSRDERSARAGARRKFLWDVAALVPASAVAVGTAGMLHNERTRVVKVPLAFSNLPQALHGFRILHLSDLHLGASRRAPDLEHLLAGLRHDPPDLIVLTGDVADQLSELEAGLKVVTEFAPRYGVYAALGNHEYLNDIAQQLPVYMNSAVRLLRDETAIVPVDDASLFLAGVDDPVFHDSDKSFYDRRIAACAGAAPSGAFRLLLCHRPSGFPAAIRNGFHLTLSGHTHGGQVGLLGRSIFEVLLGMPFLWGAYQRGESRLYTTSGFGHWFPFRLNCPAEAPIIELRRSGG